MRWFNTLGVRGSCDSLRALRPPEIPSLPIRGEIDHSALWSNRTLISGVRNHWGIACIARFDQH